MSFPLSARWRDLAPSASAALAAAIRHAVLDAHLRPRAAGSFPFR